MPRSLLLFLVGALCAAGALLIHEQEPETSLADAAVDMQRRVSAAEQWLVERTEAEARSLDSLGAEAWMRLRAAPLDQLLDREGFFVQAFLGDSLVAWSATTPFDAKPLSFSSDPHLSNARGIHLVHGDSLGTFRVLGVRTLWSAPAVRNSYLAEHFHPSLHAPRGLVASSDPNGPTIMDRTGRAVFHIGWREGAVEMGAWLWWRALLMTLAGAFFLAAAWVGCARLSISRPLMAFLLFSALLIVMRLVSLEYGRTAPFDRWALFDPAIYATSYLFPSLGDLLINTVILATAAAFLLMVTRHTKGHGLFLRALSASIGVLSIATWVTRLCIDLVTDSNIDLDLYHVQSIDIYGIIALLVIAALFATWCLVAAAAVRWVFPSDVRRPAFAFLVTVIVSVIVHHHFGIADTILFLWPVPLVVLMVVMRQHNGSFLHGVIGIALLAVTATHILTKYMQARERRERAVLCERLAVREDPVVEQLFREEAPRIRRDARLHNLLTSNTPCTIDQLDAVVREPYFSGYWERYDIRLFGLGPLGDVRCATDLEPPRSFTEEATALPQGVSDMPDLFIDEQTDEGIFYHARIAIMPSDSVPPAQLIIEASPRSAQGLGFPELLLAGDDVLSRKAERYVQARYRNGQLVEQRGETPQPQRWSLAIPPDGERWYDADGYEYLARTIGTNAVMVLGLPERSMVDKATTFSYLFTLFGLIALLVLGTWTLIARAVPSLGIGAKVRAALVLFAITGLVFFAFGSQRLLSHQFTERAEAASVEKARAVNRELRQRLGDERIVGEANTAYLEHVLGRLGNTFFTDISVYGLNGVLLASTRPQMFSTGLLSERMQAEAFVHMALRGESAWVHESAIGEARYRTAYVPLVDRTGDALAYIALPSFADQVQQEEERAQLLVAVVNLFALLFALSVLLAVFISNWTTRPLDVLKSALAGVALQGANEPIRYRGKDEVGELVAVYNRKVEELRQSAEKLARSERESAWKEMARQVAHEIKNPLTPMKLGLQHFQHTWDPNAPDAKQRLDRFTDSMVQQIDVLSRVANDFSRFAQMSTVHETELDLNDVATSAVALFAGEPNADIHLHTDVPLPIKADREHVLRVLNNLIKNALQAVPQGRRGQILVVLSRREGQAVMEVRDNGAGIPASVRDRIFEPSFTTKSSGMGLGLAMVKRMVEQAGGTVWFETSEGIGTRFFVALPLHP